MGKLTKLLLLQGLIVSGCQNGGSSLSHCKGNLLEISHYMEIYSEKHENAYTARLSELGLPYNDEPICPTGGNYRVLVNGTTFTVICDGPHDQKFPTLAPRFFNCFSNRGGLSYRPNRERMSK